MSSKPNSRDIEIPEPVKDFAKVEFNKKFKKKYKGYYDSKKDLRNGDKIILNLPSDLEELVKYINGVIFDNKKMIKLFDSIGFEDTQKIASLAVDFVSYMYTITEMVYSKKIRN